MRLLHLHLQNFRQYEDSKLAFLPGVTAIIGPNGAGKTTLLEAIAWALYGSPALRGGNDSVRRMNAPPRAPVEVVLEFSLGSHRYRIARRPDRAVLFVDDSPSPAHTGVQPVSDAARQILGMDYRAFFTSYFTGQKDLAFLTGMGKQERATSVGRMLGYERLSRARDKSNADRLALDKEIEGLKRGMGDPSSIASALTAAEGEVKAAQKAVTAAHKRHEKAKAALEAVKPKYELSSEREARHKELQNQRGLTAKDRDAAEAAITQSREELKRLDGLKKEFDAIQPDVKAYSEAERAYDAMRPLIKFEAEKRELVGRRKGCCEDMDKLEAQAKGIKAARADLEALAGKLQRVREEATRFDDEICNEREKWSNEKTALVQQQKGLNEQIKLLKQRRERVVKLGERGECPTCTRLMGDEFPSVLLHFDEEIEGHELSARKIAERLKEIEFEPAALQAARQTYYAKKKEQDQLESQREAATLQLREKETAQKKLREMEASRDEIDRKLEALPKGFDQKRFDELRDIAVRLKDVNKRSIQLQAELDRRPDWTFRLQAAEKDWQQHSERLDELDKSLKSLKFSPEAHKKLEEDYLVAAREERDADRERLEAQGALARSEGALAGARERQAEYDRKAEELRGRQEERLYRATLTEGLEKLRVELNARVRPELAEVASEFLDQLTGGRYRQIELNENYEPFLVDDGERKAVVSGGEEDVLHLSLRLAISRMIADRSGQPLSLLVLDEIFGSLDASRRENVVGLLQNLKAVFEQIVLITHIESIHDMVDQCLRVTYDPSSRTSEVEEYREAPLDFDSDLPEAA